MNFHTYYFRIAGELGFHKFETSLDDKIEAAKEWYRSYIPTLCFHEKARLVYRCGAMEPGTPLIIQMSQSAGEDAYCININFLRGIKL